MDDHTEKARQIQEMLDRLTGAERQQLIELLVRRYGTDTDIAELLRSGPIDGMISLGFARKEPTAGSE